MTDEQRAAITAEIQAIARRVADLEAAKLSDGRSIESLRAAIRELEVRCEAVTMSVKSLANTMEQSNYNWRRDLTELTAKIATLEERSKNAALAHEHVAKTVDSLNTKVTEGFANIEGKMASTADRSREEIRALLPIVKEVPWYRDFNKLKEVGTAIALIWMTVSTILAGTGHPVPGPAPSADMKPR